MIPCTTYAAGRNPFKFTFLPENKQFDMQERMMTSPEEWPYRPKNHDEEEKLPRAWCHSDLRNVAYLHTYKLYEKFIELANLNEE
jgi:hypothetical protein